MKTAVGPVPEGRTANFGRVEMSRHELEGDSANTTFARPQVSAVAPSSNFRAGAVSRRGDGLRGRPHFPADG